jgi:hypothetical protein
LFQELTTLDISGRTHSQETLAALGGLIARLKLLVISVVPDQPLPLTAGSSVVLRGVKVAKLPVGWHGGAVAVKLSDCEIGEITDVFDVSALALNGVGSLRELTTTAKIIKVSFCLQLVHVKPTKSLTMFKAFNCPCLEPVTAEIKMGIIHVGDTRPDCLMGLVGSVHIVRFPRCRLPHTLRIRPDFVDDMFMDELQSLCEQLGVLCRPESAREECRALLRKRWTEQDEADYNAAFPPGDEPAAKRVRLY